mgnify:CR=1 FL=1
MMTENENKSCILISANQHQPPPSLPRRGGTDTIGYLIIICRNLIISYLSVNGVTCSFPLGRLGWG